MERLASGVSRISISEPSLTSTTPAMAQIPPSRDLDDNGHQALDKSVLKVFELYIELNREPDWAALLSNIVNDDMRLCRIPREEADELLKRESSLMAVLRKGWIDRSFREVRRLGMSPYSLPSDYSRWCCYQSFRPGVESREVCTVSRI
jgi:hypothetical protein